MYLCFVKDCLLFFLCDICEPALYNNCLVLTIQNLLISHHLAISAQNNSKALKLTFISITRHVSKCYFYNLIILSSAMETGRCFSSSCYLVFLQHNMTIVLTMVILKHLINTTHNFFTYQKTSLLMNIGLTINSLLIRAYAPRTFLQLLLGTSDYF